MFTKALISEDMNDINNGVGALLRDLGIQEIHQVQYCDDAYFKIKKAQLDNAPFDLLITDLSFQTDYRDQKIASGEDLVKKINPLYPSLKIIVYSADNRLQKVRKLINEYKIDAYVCKGRKGLKELTKAIHLVFNNNMYLSPEVVNALSPKSDLEIDKYDIELLKQLSEGMSQEGISISFKKRNIQPNGLSSIEKRLNKLRIQFKANNAIHLVAIVKDLGLI